jgi:YidC/Oxa1 family membrane protein insertase
MDTQRLILMAAFMLVSMSLWQSWQMQVNPPPVPAITQSVNSAPADISSKSDDIPSTLVQTQTQTDSSTPQQAEVSVVKSGQRVYVKTDVYELEIDTIGADIRRVALLNYPVDVNTDTSPVILMNDKSGLFFISQTGLLAKTADSYAPDHDALYTSEQFDYELGTNSELKVPLTWTSDDGEFSVTKTYTFKPGSYAIDVEHIITNNSGTIWQGHLYRQLQRTNLVDLNQSQFIHTYTGAMVSKDVDGFSKISFDDMMEADLNQPNKGGWISMIQHYFMGAWIPPENELENYYSRVTNKNTTDPHYIIGTISSSKSVADKTTYTFRDQLFIGPKLPDQLNELAVGLDSTVDYGFLSVIAHPIHWLLEKIHSVIGNWGWSIIILTLIIKLMFYKLSETSYRSMARMRKVAPRLKAIQEQYKDNAQEKNKAMMELYKKDKINPLGGCLPIVVQIPVFIALYWVLLESVELRQADFMFWLNNLSAADPYFILPLLMGISMFIQQKLNPAPMDPVQAKVMMMLPVIFTVFFAFFPSGLVLYWVTNNILSIAQQWYITRQIENA